MTNTPSRPTRTINPDDLTGREVYHLLNSVVVPRPIAWVSSINADGVDNLAPHSFFTVVSDEPPIIAFVSMGDKDTVRNIRETGNFVVHVVNHDLAERMNVSSASAPAHVSEFELAGVTRVDASRVRSGRVLEAPVAIECELHEVVEAGRGRLILGRCVEFHVEENLFDERDRIDPAQLDAVARMGGATYSTTRDRFQLVRPVYEDMIVDASRVATPLINPDKA